MLLIKGTHLIDRLSQRDETADILIVDGMVKEIATNIPAPAVAYVIEATGLIALPGLVDTHAHFRDPGFTHKEDIASGARAMARGGSTSAVLMANTKPCGDNVATLRYVLEKGAETGLNITSCANVTCGMKGQELTDMAELAAAGAAGFSDDGLPLLDEELVRAAMREAARLGKPLCLHEEDPAYIENNGIDQEYAKTRLGLGGASREAEIALVRRDLMLAEETGATVVFQHLSTKEAVELIRQAKAQNPRIHAEATPHHFTLTAEALATKEALAKVNPPLRTEADRLAIIHGLKDGTIDIIATDHAPHSAEEKAGPLTAAPSGMIGLETALSLALRELVAPGYLTLSELVMRMSTAPARLYGLAAGEIAVGKPADIVLFDPAATWTVDGFASKSANSPFLGETLPGVVRHTICGWRII
ncbi:MAG: dihydroorotase [Lachnospiraceae bacterium]|jgi:dihydroorotase|nr:dihydroorotase [Lachnospiraceae bacterium]